MFKFDNENLLESLDLESDFDGDSCDIKTLKTVFSGQYELEAETSVSMSRCFVLHISGSVSSNSKIVAALSNYSCTVYDVPHLTKLDTTSEHKGPVSGIKFSPAHDNLFYSCSLDGLIKLWDLRSGLKKSVQVFKDDTDGTGQPKPLRSFDIACNDRFVSAGTELVDGDAFLLFWDARSSKLLGGYWESHREEITQVRFHPSKCDTVTTGSTDGLINIFDLSQGCEDDALLYSLNTEASVETLGWVTNDGAEDGLSCITQTEELQMWSIDGAAPNVHFTREDITKHIQRKSVEDCYLVNLHQNTSSQELFLIAGTTEQGGECLRTVAVKNNTLKPLSQFLENKQIVRTSWYDENNGMLVTGGESGLISLWKHSKSTLESSSSDRKMSSKVKERHKHMPY